MGSEINEKSNDEYLSRLRLEKIGFVFQTFNLLATMTAYENVELPMKLLSKLSNKQIKQRTIELLTKVGLQDRMDHLVIYLLRGMEVINNNNSHQNYQEVNNKEWQLLEDLLIHQRFYYWMNLPVI